MILEFLCTFICYLMQVKGNHTIKNVSNHTDKLYKGCPVQYARQFLAGKWQMGILWSLKNQVLRFGEIKNQLPEISDKILMQELNFFVQKGIVGQNISEFPSPRTEYKLTPKGRSLILIITSVVEWGYVYLQDELVTGEMSMTPLHTIEEIEINMAE